MPGRSRAVKGTKMASQGQYAPGAAFGAEVRKEGDAWTLVLVRDLSHPPAKVWKAITEPEHLRQWAPFDSDRSLGAVGHAKLTTVGDPSLMVSDSQVKRAEAPKLLEYTWGDQNIRWELEALGDGGTRLTLWHNINKGFIAMGAAGWHICLDVLDRLLGDRPMGRTVGPDAFKVQGFPQLISDYAKHLGVTPPPSMPSRS